MGDAVLLRNKYASYGARGSRAAVIRSRVVWNCFACWSEELPLPIARRLQSVTKEQMRQTRSRWVVETDNI